MTSVAAVLASQKRRQTVSHLDIFKKINSDGESSPGQKVKKDTPPADLNESGSPLFKNRK